jgi:hypothetical protein
LRSISCTKQRRSITSSVLRTAKCRRQIV